MECQPQWLAFGNTGRADGRTSHDEGTIEAESKHGSFGFPLLNCRMSFECPCYRVEMIV